MTTTGLPRSLALNREAAECSEIALTGYVEAEAGETATGSARHSSIHEKNMASCRRQTGTAFADLDRISFTPALRSRICTHLHAEARVSVILER